MSTTTTTDLRHAADTDVVGRARARFGDPTGSVFERLVATDARLAPAVARLALGLVMLPHALQKAFGWFGGGGFSATYEAFTTRLGVPGPLAFVAICAEIFGSIALVLGVFTRVGALAIISVMVGAIALVHAPNGFFMNWGGNAAGEGFEYHLLAIALGVVCLLQGGGAVSVDHAMMRRGTEPERKVIPVRAAPAREPSPDLP